MLFHLNVCHMEIEIVTAVQYFSREILFHELKSRIWFWKEYINFEQINKGM